MIYIYPEQNLRAYPGTIRGTQEWDSTYKIRVNVEKSINHLKDSFCVAGHKTQNEKTLHADLLLAVITQLITVMVADKIHKHQYIRSLKPLSISSCVAYCFTSRYFYLLCLHALKSCFLYAPPENPAIPNFTPLEQSAFGTLNSPAPHS